MKRMLGVTFLLAALVAWMPVASAQNTLDTVEKAVTANWDKVSSVSTAFDLAAKVKIRPDQPNPLPITGGGTIDYAKKKDVVQYKGYVWAGLTPTAKMAQAQGGTDGKEGFYDLSVPLASLNESGSISPSDLVAPGGKALFDALREHFTDLAVAADEKVGDKDCYVITGALKEKIKNVPIDKGRLYLAKDTGVPMKVVVINADGEEMGSIVMKDTKLNGELPASTFVHMALAVPGASAAPAAPAAAPAAKPATTAKPAAAASKPAAK